MHGDDWIDSGCISGILTLIVMNIELIYSIVFLDSVYLHFVGGQKQNIVK